MRPPVDVHVEVPAPYEYKPKKIDDAGFMRDVGIGLLIVMGAIGILVAVIRKLRDRRLSRAANLVDHDAVTLTGIVRARDKTLVAPLSGTTCVAHRTRAYVAGLPGLNGREAVSGMVPAFTQIPGRLEERPVLDERVPFSIEVDGGMVELDEELVFEVTPMRLPPAPTKERAFLERFGLADKHERAGFDEIVIPLKAKLTVKGMLRIEANVRAAGERGYRDDAPTRMRLVANGDKPVTVVRVWGAS